MVMHKPAGFARVQAVNADIIWHFISHFCSSPSRSCYSSAVKCWRSTFLWDITTRGKKGCLPIKDAIRTRDMPINDTQYSWWPFVFSSLLLFSQLSAEWWRRARKREVQRYLMNRVVSRSNCVSASGWGDHCISCHLWSNGLALILPPQVASSRWRTANTIIES